MDYPRSSTLVLALAALVAVPASDALAARKCLKFSDLPMGATYTAPFVSGGVSIDVLSFYWDLGHPCAGPTGFGFARVQASGDVPGGSAPKELEVNNVRVAFDMATFLGGAAIKKVKLKYIEMGGNVNISVNGDCYSLGNFTDLPNGTLIGGVKYRRSATRIVLKAKKKNSIKDFEIGGQEFIIDDVCAYD